MVSLLLLALISRTGLVRPFEIGWDYTRVAVLQYSDDPRIEFYLKDYQDKTTLLDAIDSIPYKGISNIIAIMWYSNTVKGGNTRTGDAIRFMMDRIFSIEAGSRPAVKKHMVLLTDGRSQVSTFDELELERCYVKSTV